MTENIIGPISKSHFYTMGMLKHSLKWMQDRNDEEGRFNLGIQREKALLKDYLKKAALTKKAA